MNNVSLIGRLVFDPELKYVNDDRAVCTFCLAVCSLRIDKYVNKDCQNRTKAIINAYNFHFLGHKHRSSDHRKVFEDKDIFKDVINDSEVFEGELSEDQITF